MKQATINLFSQRVVLMLAVSAAGWSQALKVEKVANPAGPVSLEAHWSVAQDGSPLLSWIEPLKGGSYSLRYSIRHGAQWSEPRTIVADRHFFRQPAEAPSVVSFPGGGLLAEWVEVPANESGEAEYIYVSASKDGMQWTPPVMAHQDRSPVQHALVSMAVSGDQEASLIWLAALKGEDDPSQLKRTVVSSDGKVKSEEVLEPDVCTCCPTSIVKTGRGLLVAYRGHTAKNIRDINIKRFENGRWAPAKVLNADQWEINACPVNGAAAAANGTHVAVAWYTEAQDKPRTQVMFSDDAGATFGKPVVTSTGNAFGHSSVALDNNGSAIVSWIEEGKEGSEARILVRTVGTNGSAGPVTEVAQGSIQSLGYPRLLHAGADTWITWGNSAKAKIETAKLTK
jgi:hypothetical protein